MLSSDELRKSCSNLDSALQIQNDDVVDKDIDGKELYEEMCLYKDLFPTPELPLKKLEKIIKTNLVSSFPNLTTALKIFLTLPVSVATGERSFSKLKIIENYLRTSMSQEKDRKRTM